ncbi:hypothetical protein F4775DRAFT_23949 [Biscogniauxia sp. FL1348]|nr:hypothetical protein F4775DRAFT_23949 [Biscogniauxia sp. FL1348]
MTNSNGGPSSILEQTGLDAVHQHGQARNTIGEQVSTHSSSTVQADPGSRAEAHDEAVKDQVDGAIAQGPKKADQFTGGRVNVAETGDLHDLAAAKRQS